MARRIGSASVTVCGWRVPAIATLISSAPQLSGRPSRPKPPKRTYGLLRTSNRAFIRNPAICAAEDVIYRLSLNPFAIYQPVSSAVGLFQMTDPAYAGRKVL
jgi:hypothetical protein